MGVKVAATVVGLLVLPVPGVLVRVTVLVGPPGVLVIVAVKVDVPVGGGGVPGVFVLVGVLVAPQPEKVKLICIPAERPPVLHSNCVKRAAVASCTPTVVEVPD